MLVGTPFGASSLSSPFRHSESGADVTQGVHVGLLRRPERSGHIAHDAQVDAAVPKTLYVAEFVRDHSAIVAREATVHLRAPAVRDGLAAALPAEPVLARFSRNRNRHVRVTRGRSERSQAEITS